MPSQRLEQLYAQSVPHAELPADHGLLLNTGSTDANDKTDNGAEGKACDEVDDEAGNEVVTFINADTGEGSLLVISFLPRARGPLLPVVDASPLSLACTFPLHVLLPQ